MIDKHLVCVPVSSVTHVVLECSPDGFRATSKTVLGKAQFLCVVPSATIPRGYYFHPFPDDRAEGAKYRFSGFTPNKQTNKQTQIQHQSPPSPHLRINAPSNNPNKDRFCQYFPRGLTSQKTLRKPPKQNALVQHNLSLFTTSRRMWLMIFRLR